MWKPRSYSDIEAVIGVIAESPDLDFKREFSKPTDLAKDIAAMSVQGGVIAYGIDEDSPVGRERDYSHPVASGAGEDSERRGHCDLAFAVARRLLDRFLVSFVPEHMDTFMRLKSTF